MSAQEKSQDERSESASCLAHPTKEGRLPAGRPAGNPVFPTEEYQEIDTLFLCPNPLWIRVLAS